MQGNRSSITLAQGIVARCVGGDLDWPVGMFDLDIERRSVGGESPEPSVAELHSLKMAMAARDRQPETANLQRL